MEQKIIKEFLTANECEQFFNVLDIFFQCQQVEKQLAIKKSQESIDESQINQFKKHMFLLIHAQICRTSVSFATFCIFK